jgi:hypothetical protein
VDERLNVGCDKVTEIVEGDERGLDMVGQARIAGHPVGGLIGVGQCCRCVQERRQTTQDLFVTVKVKMRNLTRQFTRSDDRQNTGDRSTCCVINVTNKMSLPVSARQRE